ncbi:transglycosylase SLT domain-containing protein [Pararhizobium mangrovi]|uniref:Lytic transglycosylase domain-containing protein n=1 Tax=Pararhizobium mangrovi TaxID=2590452 RepID=A0A506U2U2_9HYPH|nr:transglycosylase SLT domain-containing protein [Pararhizobium mangrovi]TPW26899.1 lytic transglycosylase domain-containing protein [Pararhizobium mangrovi]
MPATGSSGSSLPASRQFRAKTSLLAATLLAASISSAAAATIAAAPAGACERQILAAAQRYSVPAGILYSVGLAETGHKGSLHPFALNIAGKAVFAGSRSAALAEFEAARRAGTKLIDLGCMQINYHYHHEAFPSVAAMLDPARNVDYAARFLARLHRQHVSWTMAVARYHAGPNNNPAQKQYVCRVIRNLVATGYGRWTPAARRFCS